MQTHLWKIYRHALAGALGFAALIHLGCGAGVSSSVAPAGPRLSAGANQSSVFIGASIIQRWPLPLHNAGIIGQTTTQVLARFKADVIGHGYTRVIILAGVNDILTENPEDPALEITTHLQAMAAIAKAAGIQVVLESLPPVVQNGVDRNATVLLVNAAIQQLAADHGYIYVDNFTPMYGHRAYSVDGIHPNATGYAVMEGALASVVTD